MKCSIVLAACAGTLFMVGAQAANTLPACQGTNTKSWSNCFGKTTLPSGQNYEGTWLDGWVHGFGIWAWPEGGFYVGEFAKGKMEGKGVYITPEGHAIKEGIWSNDEFVRATPVRSFTSSGTPAANAAPCQGTNTSNWSYCYGETTFTHNNKYAGFWIDGKLNGYGVYMFGEKTYRYVGEFKQSVRSGRGVFFNGDGSVPQEGIWENDQLAQEEPLLRRYLNSQSNAAPAVAPAAAVPPPPPPAAAPAPAAPPAPAYQPSPAPPPPPAAHQSAPAQAAAAPAGELLLKSGEGGDPCKTHSGSWIHQAIQSLIPGKGGC